MKYPVIQLKRGKEESLDRFHPWVFSGAIAKLPDGIEEGDVVIVKAFDDRTIGVGHYQIGSIAVRMLDFGLTEIDKTYYTDRLAAALRLRKALGLERPDNNAYRLVHPRLPNWTHRNDNRRSEIIVGASVNHTFLPYIVLSY